MMPPLSRVKTSSEFYIKNVLKQSSLEIFFELTKKLIVYSATSYKKKNNPNCHCLTWRISLIILPDQFAINDPLILTAAPPAISFIYHLYFREGISTIKSSASYSRKENLWLLYQSVCFKVSKWKLPMNSLEVRGWFCVCGKYGLFIMSAVMMFSIFVLVRTLASQSRGP